MRRAIVWLVRLAVATLLILGMQPVGLLHAEEEAFILPEGKVGALYEYRIQTEGGLPPLNWKLVAGELPPGIELLPPGVLRGVPTTPRREPYEFTVEVSDSSQGPQTFSQPFALLIRPAPLRMVLGSGKLKIVVPGQNDPTRRGGAPTPSARPSDPETPVDEGRLREGAATPAPKATEQPTTAPARTSAAPVVAEGVDQPAPVSGHHAATSATVPAEAPQAPGGVPPVSGSSIFTRLLAGVDLSAASSLPTQQKFFLDFTLNHPVHFFTKRNALDYVT